MAYIRVKIIILIINIIINIIIITDNTRDWCDCGTGTKRVDVWDPNNPNDKVRVYADHPKTIKWIDYVPEVKWQCDGQSTIGTTTLAGNTKELYVDLHTENKFPCPFFGKPSGRLAWATPAKL